MFKYFSVLILLSSSDYISCREPRLLLEASLPLASLQIQITGCVCPSLTTTEKATLPNVQVPYSRCSLPLSGLPLLGHNVVQMVAFTIATHAPIPLSHGQVYGSTGHWTAHPECFSGASLSENVQNFSLQFRTPYSIHTRQFLSTPATCNPQIHANIYFQPCVCPQLHCSGDSSSFLSLELDLSSSSPWNAVLPTLNTGNSYSSAILKHSFRRKIFLHPSIPLLYSQGIYPIFRVTYNDS